MIDALPPEEVLFHSSEGNLLVATGYSQALFDEIENRYAFVGGTYDDYATYFNRELPLGMWDFVTGESVVAVSGFAVVPKTKT